MTTMSNKLNAGLDKVRDTQPAAAAATPAPTTTPKAAPTRAPVRRKPEAAAPAQPVQPKTAEAPAPREATQTFIPAVRVWPD